MTYAQLTVIADAARREVATLLYEGSVGDLDLEVGFEREQADAAGQLAYNAVIDAGVEFIHPLRVDDRAAHSHYSKDEGEDYTNRDEGDGNASSRFYDEDRIFVDENGEDR